MKLMVTGATGQLGSLIVESLLQLVPANSLAVSVRSPKKAEAWSALGVDVRYGDFDKPESLVSAFDGIDRLLIVSTADIANRVQQHNTAIKAAQQAGVGFLVYTSSTNAAESKFIVALDHGKTEEAIVNAGIPYSILRNNWYLENESDMIKAAANGAPWVTSAGNGKVGWAGCRDYAEAAARVLSGEGHEHTIYELSGTPLQQEELAAIVAEVIQNDVNVQQVDDETYGNVMNAAGVPEPVIPFLVAIQSGIREGLLEMKSDDLPKLLGRSMTPLHEVIRKLIS
ncbi:NAD(P)-dependent oxidoreductase [Paenibacillus sp. BIHB 4019]|uniref:NAD(P)-dependent oxidoreductase n=1 Tax=Paenibacillus sp. BIHB 4019 TaxID=1870819 RepID=A0A1B2DQS6_9BACL|nr:SDR family oxidoreductase [Paenibacillus sp. BIHB 4019]ANY70058.1 NAD(P)-dependent oxidoreductase [Paenibacillus sp. BIHB 4019]